MTSMHFDGHWVNPPRSSDLCTFLNIAPFEFFQSQVGALAWAESDMLRPLEFSSARFRS